MSEKKTWAWAVIDGNQAPDMWTIPDMFSDTYADAAAWARKNNCGAGHYYVIEWNASASAKLRPGPDHYPCDRWLEDEAARHATQPTGTRTYDMADGVNFHGPW